jgi:5-methyltetrahydropteroyltriglutamate--homocysteine methyltransferase
MITHNLGFPRIGAKRELKKALEAFWSGKISESDLRSNAAAIRRENWFMQQTAGIDLIPSNDFSFYDHVLDTCALVGAVPERFESVSGHFALSTYFEMARGRSQPGADCGGCSHATTAMEMTKWFDTNYHYLVPELTADAHFHVSSTKPMDEFMEAKGLGIITKVVLLGPVTFLLLSKPRGSEFNCLDLLPRLLPVYEEVLANLASVGAKWVQFDEPMLATDLPDGAGATFKRTYERIGAAAPSVKLMLATYFGDLESNLRIAADLPVDALHIDLVRAPGQMERALSSLPARMQLSLGVVDGRNIWKNDFQRSLTSIRTARKRIGSERLMIAPSCSLLHTPVSLAEEIKMDEELKSWLSFAQEKLAEVATLHDLAEHNADESILKVNEETLRKRSKSSRIHHQPVKTRAAAVSPGDLSRKSPYEVRSKKQSARLQLPLLPTTTIGSFPQTDDVRSGRAKFKKGELSSTQYAEFLKEKTAHCIRFQEGIGLDVLVHGEFERNDMVEYFGEQLEGFAFTQNGWVQSYGSRCVKPPIIFGDVHRPKPMTIEWSQYAQSVTRKPMKGMLTGPITILQWSFVRDDQPRSETAKQIALAVREEVRDLEAAGLQIIQIDEPALREGLPLRRSRWAEYLRWAVDAFRLCSSVVRDETQIHTHMCYCEFDDIISAIAELDADVISIETSRSNMELLGTFARFKYPNEIGPGVWDIHSPRVPTTEEMIVLLKAAMKVIPPERLWLNPDCGLKTRRWEEVIPALKNLVTVAKTVRQQTLIQH